MTVKAFYADSLATEPGGNMDLVYPKGNAKVYWAADYDALAAELALEKQLRADVTFSNVTFIKQIRRLQASEEEQKTRIRELEAARDKLLSACQDSDDAQYGTLSTTFVQTILGPTLKASPPYPWCHQPSVCRGTCPMDPSCGE